MNKVYKQIREGLSDLLIVWNDEFRSVFSDAAVVLLFVVAPLIYPVIYGLIYSHEVAEEAKLVVVDLDNSAQSRDFRRRCDATRDVQVVAVTANLEEAKEMVRRQEAYGVMLFPRDFSRKIARKEQATIQLYCEMSSLLYYKCFLMTATEVSLNMGKEIQISRLDINTVNTKRETDIATSYIKYDNCAFFNPQSGFDSFLLPAFVMLLTQQTLIIGICVMAGDAYDRKRFHRMLPILRHKRGTFRIVLGKTLCYLCIYLVSAFYMLLSLIHI